MEDESHVLRGARVVIHPGNGSVSDHVDYGTDSSNDTERDSDSDYATHSSNNIEYVERDSDSERPRKKSKCSMYQ